MFLLAHYDDLSTDLPVKCDERHCQVIDDAQLSALRAHFATGSVIEPGISFLDQELPSVSTVLHVTELSISPFGDAQIVVTDGSEGSGPGGRIGACAAVAADGRVLIAWFTVPSGVGKAASTYAEWQGARLGLRLTEGWTAAQLLTDNRSVATQLRRVLSGLKVDARFAGGNDQEAMDEIGRLAHAVPLTVRWVHGENDEHITACTPMARAAHAAAWLTRRMVADGISPAEHTDWLSGKIAEGTRFQSSLYRAYQLQFPPEDQPQMSNSADGGQRQRAISTFEHLTAEQTAAGLDAEVAANPGQVEVTEGADLLALRRRNTP
jgi:hypothetical protein